MLVTSPKTEHHPGGESRLVPLFPELRPYLDESLEQAEPGTEYVIMRYRVTNMNLRTQLMRIIKRAGLKPWPKLFQNLRSTRQTELEENFPSHVVCAWIGNSEAVAKKHYLQVTDEHFKKAVQQAHVTARKPTVWNQRNPYFPRGLRPLAIYCKSPRWAMMDSNYPRKPRGIQAVRSKAAQNPAHSAHGKPQSTPNWRQWSMPGRRCRRQSRPAS
jgi:hypothetical protein